MLLSHPREGGDLELQIDYDSLSQTQDFLQRGNDGNVKHPHKLNFHEEVQLSPLAKGMPMARGETSSALK